MGFPRRDLEEPLCKGSFNKGTSTEVALTKAKNRRLKRFMDNPAEKPNVISELSQVGNVIKTLLKNYEFSASNRGKLVEATNLLYEVFVEVTSGRDEEAKNPRKELLNRALV